MSKKVECVFYEKKSIGQEIGEILAAAAIVIISLGMAALLLGVLGFSFAWAGIEVWTGLPKTVWHTLTTEGIGSVIRYQWDLFAIVFLAVVSIKVSIKEHNLEEGYGFLFIGIVVVQLLRQIQNGFIFHYGLFKVIWNTIGGSFSYLIVPTLILVVVNRVFRKSNNQ